MVNNRCPVCTGVIKPTEEEKREWRKILERARQRIIDPRLIHDAVLREVVGDYSEEGSDVRKQEA